MKRLAHGVYSFFAFVGGVIADFFQRDATAHAARSAFYLLLSIFPLVLLLVSVVELLYTGVRPEIINMLVPSGSEGLLNGLLVTGRSGISVVTILLLIWSASSGLWNLMLGIYHAGSQEKMPDSFRRRILSLVLTVGFVVVNLLTILLSVFGEYILEFMEQLLPNEGELVSRLFRYATSLLIQILFIMPLYYCAAPRKVKVKHLVPGVLTASTLWTVGLVVFEFYMSRFSRYSVLYGSIGTFMGLAMWMLLLSIIILAGAHVNERMFAKERGETVPVLTDLIPKDWKTWYKKRREKRVTAHALKASKPEASDPQMTPPNDDGGGTDSHWGV